MNLIKNMALCVLWEPFLLHAYLDWRDRVKTDEKWIQVVVMKIMINLEAVIDFFKFWGFF